MNLEMSIDEQRFEMEKKPWSLTIPCGTRNLLRKSRPIDLNIHNYTEEGDHIND